MTAGIPATISMPMPMFRW